MPAYVWITALAAVALVAWVAFGRRWWHALWYSWTRAAHVIDLTEREPVAAPEYGSMIYEEERRERERQQIRRAQQDTWLGELPAFQDWLPAPTVDPEPWHPDWREQTAADLAPEALEALETLDAWGPRGPSASYEAWLRDEDPGPGDAAVIPPASSGPDHDAPGWPWAAAPVAGAGEVGITAGPQGIPAAPAQPPPSRWLAEQLDILRAWSERQRRYAEILA